MTRLCQLEFYRHVQVIKSKLHEFNWFPLVHCVLLNIIRGTIKDFCKIYIYIFRCDINAKFCTMDL